MNDHDARSRPDPDRRPIQEDPDRLEERLRSVPRSPGCYLFKDARGRILYVGKAKALAGRVRSYFRAGADHTPRTASMVSRVHDLDFIATENELEALLLEQSLIQEHRPRYNVRLRDDKRYPFIAITWNEELPRVLPTRRVDIEGAEYFGPYTDVKAMRKTLWLLQTIFPVRTCPGDLKYDSLDRECLEYFIHRCAGPCTGRIPREEYLDLVRNVRLFLQGRNGELRRVLVERMREHSEGLEYERAAAVRDRIHALDKVTERQVVVSRTGGDQDVLALVRDGARACGVIAKIREGRMLASEAHFYRVDADDPENELFTTFFHRYYRNARAVPRRVLVSHSLRDRDLLRAWLAGRRGAAVEILEPARGMKRDLVEMALRNAGHQLEQHLVESGARSGGSTPALRALQHSLELPALPRRIECYDVSNIQGAEPVGSMVTFRGGTPWKNGYRRFKIKTVEGQDDFAMLEEVLRRRFGHVLEGKDPAPDLVVVDGGRGQLNRARTALRELGFTSLPAVGLAKRREEVHLPGSPEPLLLPRTDPGLRLLQRIRDEAYRFAIEYHRKLRGRRSLASDLDRIPGVGEKKKIQLLHAFGSVEAMRGATREELARVPGVGPRLAEAIADHLGLRRKDSQP
jgi:excinuclease ABC subunit C